MKKLAFAAFLLMSSAMFAQTTIAYQASAGTVSSFNQVKANLDLGGSFDTVQGFGGPNCYFGTCDMSYSNHPFNYVLPDGTAATFNNLAGTADFRNQYDVKIDGDASGYDSNNVPVTIKVHIDFTANCRSGRGGGCIKKFLDGTLTVTK